jgi:hypothetical protein
MFIDSACEIRTIGIKATNKEYHGNRG